MGLHRSPLALARLRNAIEANNTIASTLTQSNTTASAIKTSPITPKHVISDGGGIEIDRIANKIDQAKNIERVTCPICLKTIWKPISCSVCLKAFCEDCISKCQSKLCPNRCGIFKVRKVPPITNDILSDIKVACLYSINGCGEVLRYDTLERHENKCGFVASQCRGCKKLICKKELEIHEASCDSVILQCKNCESMLKRVEMESHTQVNCLQSQVDYLQSQVKSMSSIIKMLVPRFEAFEKNRSTTRVLSEEDDNEINEY